MKFSNVLPIVLTSLAVACGRNPEMGGGKSLETIVVADSEEFTEANLFLRNFPDATSLPGAKEVRKYETPGAKYTLVHVLHGHGPAFPPLEFDEESFNNSERAIQQKASGRKTALYFSAIQRDVYNILDYLRKDESIQLEGAFDEGIHAEVSNPDIAFRAGKNMTGNFFSGGYLSKREMENLMQTDFRFLLGAARLHCIEGNLKILPGDDRGLVDAARFNPRDFKIQEGREDASIRIMMNYERSCGVIIYGAFHAFGGRESFSDYVVGEIRLYNKDNIACWNEQNPDRKISLIEVIPNNLDVVGR